MGVTTAGTTYTYKWSQTACDGAVCETTTAGSWIFQQYAVERGRATYFGLRDQYPQFDTDGVVSFNFTIGAFVYKTINFGPLTWTNNAALGGIILRQQGGSYNVQFSDDRHSIAGVNETAFSGAITNPTATGFELAPTNPTILLSVSANSIAYHQATGSEPFGPDGIPVRPSAGLQGQWALAGLTSLVGDKDDFTAGQAADVPPRSAYVKKVLKSIARKRGQGLPVDFDAGGVNRSVGWTHEFVIPPNTRITSGSLKIRVRANDDSSVDDVILYNDFTDTDRSDRDRTERDRPDRDQDEGDRGEKHRDLFKPFIAVRDLPPLSGRALQPGEEITLEIDLSSVPVHLEHEHRDKQSPPDEYRNLVPLLEHGQFDVIVSDDLSVDYSELSVGLAGASSP